MLVLSRKKNESIVINNDITIVVVEIRGDKVRLGVEAPKEVPVHRREVYDAIKRNEMARAKMRPVKRERPNPSLSFAIWSGFTPIRLRSPCLSGDVCLLLP